MTKAEARLESLRGAGIDVHKWLQKAKDSHKNDQLQPSTLGKLATKLIASESNERFYLKIFYNVFINSTPLSLSSSFHPLLLASNRASQLSLPMSGGSQEFDVETSSIQSGQIGSEFDTISIGSIKSEYPKYCIVLYHYKVHEQLDMHVHCRL